MALLDGTGELQQPISQRRLAVVDVRDDREVPDPLRRVQRQLSPDSMARLTGAAVPSYLFKV